MSKVAIITGGLSGIGLAVAKRLHVEGLSVCIAARRGDDPDMAAQVQQALDAPVHVAGLDVRDSASVTEFVDDIETRHGRIDCLVNAAGVYREAAIIDHPDVVWDDMIDTNLSGTFKMIRAVMPLMKAQNCNIASVAAHNGMAGNAAYCASKAGLLGLGRCVSLEAAASGVFRTEVMVRYEASNPQGSLVQPEEIAALVTFLVSDAGRTVTMEDIQVNAGALW